MDAGLTNGTFAVTDGQPRPAQFVAALARFGMRTGPSVKNSYPAARRVVQDLAMPNTSRRQRTKTIGHLGKWVSSVLVLTGALTCAAGGQTPNAGMEQAPGILPSGLGEAVDRDVARVRAATERFKSTDAAEASGYKRVTDCVEHQPDGAMGYHFQNNALLDTTLDVERPEVLVYERKPDGSFKLNGVEFLVPISAWTASDPPRVMGQALKRADRLGIWYLHAWTWEASPSGIFADWNPRVTCGDAQ